MKRPDARPGPNLSLNHPQRAFAEAQSRTMKGYSVHTQSLTKKQLRTLAGYKALRGWPKEATLELAKRQQLEEIIAIQAKYEAALSKASRPAVYRDPR